MTYLPLNRTGQPPLDGIADSFGDVGLALKSVAQDPCLFKVAGLALRLNQLEQAKPTKPGAPAAPPTKGVGLCSAVAPLNALIYVRQRPWVLPAAGLAIVAALVGIGYAAGRSGGKGT